MALKSKVCLKRPVVLSRVGTINSFTHLTILQKILLDENTVFEYIPNEPHTRHSCRGFGDPEKAKSIHLRLKSLSFRGKNK